MRREHVEWGNGEEIGIERAGRARAQDEHRAHADHRERRGHGREPGSSRHAARARL